MHTGDIISYHRRKQKLTQDGLGNGICSVTHISKIERGLTEVSHDTIALLAERLHIDLIEEQEKVKWFYDSLEDLQHEISFVNIEKATEIMNKLKKKCEDFYDIQPLQYRYLLLSSWCLFLNDNIEEGYEKLVHESQKYDKLPQYGQGLHKHVEALFLMRKGYYKKALQTLNEIDKERYENESLHFHLSLLYYHCDTPILSYHHGMIAQDGFKKKHNFRRLIDIEITLLMLIEDHYVDNQEDVFKRYNELLQIASRFATGEQLQSIHHNLAYQYYRIGNYEKSAEYYLGVYKSKPTLVQSYFGYVRSIIEGNLKDKHEGMVLIERGIAESMQQKKDVYHQLFTAYKLKLSDEESFYPYVKDTLLPTLVEKEYKKYCKKYYEILLDYYHQEKKYLQLYEVSSKYHKKIYGD